LKNATNESGSLASRFTLKNGVKGGSGVGMTKKTKAGGGENKGRVGRDAKSQEEEKTRGKVGRGLGATKINRVTDGGFRVNKND